MPGHWREDPEIKALMVRREREIRTVQAVVGALGGAGVAFMGACRAEATAWALVVLTVGGAIGGATAGWHTPFWKTALPGDDDSQY